LDAALSRRAIAKFSSRDAEAYPKYEAMLEPVAEVIEPTLDMTPPDLSLVRKPEAQVPNRSNGVRCHGGSNGAGAAAAGRGTG
jgi:hypothetical protein